MRLPPMDELVAGVRAGKRALLARAITLVESTHPDHMTLAQELLRALAAAGGDSDPQAEGGVDSARLTVRVGITGVPGVGKSTFIERLGMDLCEQGHRVAVLAVDPSSSVRGGSILGDKTRMGELSRHPRAYIRPSPTSGSLGGVHRRTRESMRVVEAAGYDVVLVETVGVGQSETAVAGMVDTFVVLMLAGAGDELQGIKKGILEVADVLAINKADGDNALRARQARSRYASALRVVKPADPRWRTRVLTCSGLEGAGLDGVWQTVRDHRAALGSHLQDKRRSQDLAWMWALVDGELLSQVRRAPQTRALSEELAAEVQAGRLPPTLAAWQLLDAFWMEHGS